MEFSEKMQQLRKEKGLTQEEAAEALFVSRTAISKWESGRGYPGIDSLKEIARFYGVTIDELLSGDRLVSIAEKERQASLRELRGMAFALVDLLFILLILLPLYPKAVDGVIWPVNLPAYTDASVAVLVIHWVLALALTGAGLANLVLHLLRRQGCRKLITALSLSLNGLAVLFLALTREPYAVTLAFLLMCVKTALVFKA